MPWTMKQKGLLGIHAHDNFNCKWWIKEAIQSRFLKEKIDGIEDPTEEKREYEDVRILPRSCHYSSYIVHAIFNWQMTYPFPLKNLT